MTIVAFIGIFILLAYLGMIITGMAKRSALIAFKWLAIAIVCIAGVYAICYVFQDSAPRLYESTPLLCIISSLITLIFGFIGIFSNKACEA